MPSLILVVFIFQLLIHLVSTFGGQTINDLLWLLYTKLPTPQAKQAAAGVQLRKEVVKLNREMTNTSAQDDFSKWAKLRRQHDKKKAEYEKNAQSLQSFRSNFDRIASTLRWLGTSGVRFLMQFWFSKQALFWIPQGWAPYYVEWLLSFPRAPLGSVSVNMWWIACASVIKMASEGLVALWTLKTGEVKVGEKKGEKVKMDFGAGMGQAGEKKEL
ncbi:Protein GET1 [Cladosporium halotolerans]|uniref:Protein GET1 n=1 Tax=Cladosporium halotolerans TaxID=1052096 RepID=A0AB34KT83_9PEZI